MKRMPKLVRPILLGLILLFSVTDIAAQTNESILSRIKDFPSRFRPEGPLDEYMQECVFDRSSLTATVLARNLELYPGIATPTGSGWLVYDRYLKQVVELDEDLTIIQHVGKEGEGPLEYGTVVALLKVNDLVVVVDRSPPSVLVFGDEEKEHRLDVIPKDIGLHGGKVLLADRHGDIHELSLSTGDRSPFRDRTDLGLPKPKPREGVLPEIRLRRGYVGFLGTSTIWGGGGSRLA